MLWFGFMVEEQDSMLKSLWEPIREDPFLPNGSPWISLLLRQVVSRPTDAGCP